MAADHHQAGHERCHGLRDSCSAITNAKFRSEDYVCTHFSVLRIYLQASGKIYVWILHLLYISEFELLVNFYDRARRAPTPSKVLL